jgi:hypothetical protein
MAAKELGAKEIKNLAGKPDSWADIGGSIQRL